MRYAFEASGDCIVGSSETLGSGVHTLVYRVAFHNCRVIAIEDGLETVLKLDRSFPESNTDAAFKKYASYVHIRAPTIISTILFQRLSRSTCTRKKC